MPGFLDKFRTKIKTNVFKEASKNEIFIDDKIALGVLLWIVAKADDKFLPEEEAQIKETLIKYCDLNNEDLDLVLNSIKEAEKQAVDLYAFTSVIVRDLDGGKFSTTPTFNIR